MITIRFSDPGLHPTTIELTSGYTLACVTADGKDYWLQRFLGQETWLPFALHQAMRPYFSEEDV